jgi:hypothetical protein
MTNGRWAAVIGALAVSLSGAPGNADPPSWRPIETLDLATDAAHPPSQLSIERSDAAPARLRVTIRRPSGETIPDMFGEGLVPLKDGVAAKLAATNRLRSDYAFAAPVLDRLPGRRVLLFFGGPDPPTMHLMIVGATSFETYGGGVFLLTKIVRAGRRTELIGRRVRATAISRCRSTYAPYAVLVFIGAKDSSLDYSPSSSRTYNRAHYVWAGPRAGHHALVDTCGARPRLVRGPST